MSKEMRMQLDELKARINELIAEIEKDKQENPRHALFDARRACEVICEHICIEKKLIKKNSKFEKPNLSTMIHLIDTKLDIPKMIVHDMRTVQKYGNMAVHSSETFQSGFAEPSLSALSNLVRWYFKEDISQPNIHKPPESSTNKRAFLEKARETIKKPLFVTAAVGVMAGTLVAITKGTGKRK